MKILYLKELWADIIELSDDQKMVTDFYHSKLLSKMDRYGIDKGSSGEMGEELVVGRVEGRGWW